MIRTAVDGALSFFKSFARKALDSSRANAKDFSHLLGSLTLDQQCGSVALPLGIPGFLTASVNTIIQRAADDLEVSPAWQSMEASIGSWEDRLPGEGEDCLPGFRG